jgi:hypothetical protein
MVVQGARERMFRPCRADPHAMLKIAGLLPVDLICRIAGVAFSYIYAFTCMSLEVATIINSAL